MASRRCLDCSKLIPTGSRCDDCRKRVNRERERRRGPRPARSSEYRRNAAQVAAEAVACHWCGRPFTNTNRPQADHLQPWSQGGSDDLANLVPSCQSCNVTRGNQLRRKAP